MLVHNNVPTFFIDDCRENTNGKLMTMMICFLLMKANQKIHFM
jgi:hypothetical protein